MSSDHWAKFLLTLSFKCFSATLLSAAIITRSFLPCSTAVAYGMCITFWEWRERGRKGKKETEGGNGVGGQREIEIETGEGDRQITSFMV